MINKKCLQISIPLLLSLVAYSRILSNKFVFDDLYLIEKNKWITDIRYIREIFTSSSWSFLPKIQSGTYRPLQHIMYMPIYAFTGLNPWGYHLVSIILHALNTLLVSLFVRILLKGYYMESNDTSKTHIDLLSMTAALIFAVHPIHTEAVAWASSMSELVVTALLLSSFLLYLRWAEGMMTIKAYIASFLLFFLAIFLKEISLILPAILISYDIYRRRFTLSTPIIARYVPYIIGGIIYIIIRFSVVGMEIGHKVNYNLTLSQNILNIFPIIFMYFYKLAIPINLNASYGFDPIYTMYDPRFIGSMIFFLLLLSILFTTFFRNRFSFFLLCWTILPILPVLYIPALGRNPFAERYLYLPSAGFLLLVVYLLDNLHTKTNWAWKRAFVSFAITGVILIFSISTFQRNKVWRDESTLWSDSIKKSPENFVALHRLGRSYLAVGRWENAAEILAKAIRVETRKMPHDPVLAETHFLYGLALEEMGRRKEAFQEYKKAIKLKPSHPQAHYRLAMIYRENGLINDAIKELLKAIRSKPDYKDAIDALKSLHRMKGAIGDE